MEKKQGILKYRERLDQTLASPHLRSMDSLAILISNQMHRSSSQDVKGDIRDLVQRKATEASYFLQMLRSTSGNTDEATGTHVKYGDWKIKQDHDQYRIMYREGPRGSPFHTMLVEGCVTGSIDTCLCVGWETDLFEKWWPQFSVPPFKVIFSSCLKRIRIDEQISLVRVKVPWPLTTREAALHLFELEYLQDELILVLVNTVSATENVGMKTHGYTRDEIPEAKDMIRIDLVGGFALKRMSSNITYFRTIFDMDLKIDLVPPAIINFISRQLLGSGFKHYKRIVASAAGGDQDFGKALQGPLYIRVREGLKSRDTDEVQQIRAEEADKPVINHVQFNEIEDITQLAGQVIEEENINDSSSHQLSSPCPAKSFQS